MSFLNITRKTPNNNWDIEDLPSIAYICSYGNYGANQNIGSDCKLYGGTVIPYTTVKGIVPKEFDPYFRIANVENVYYALDFFGSPLAKPKKSCNIPEFGENPSPTSSGSPLQKSGQFFLPANNLGLSLDSSISKILASKDLSTKLQAIKENFNNFQNKTPLNKLKFPDNFDDIAASTTAIVTEEQPTTNYLKSRMADSNPGSCCYWSSLENEWKLSCADVSSEYECYNLNLNASKDGFRYRFWPGYSSASTVCIPVSLSKEAINNLNNCNPDIGGCYDNEYILGNCYSNGKLKISTKKDCSTGYWISAKNNSIPKNIDKTYLPKEENLTELNINIPLKINLTTDRFEISEEIINTIDINPNTISTDILLTTTDINIKLPAIGTEYQGGIYIGTFTAGNKDNLDGSIVYGNFKTGTPKTYNARNTETTKYKSWILIAAPYDLDELPINYQSNQNTQNKIYLNETYPKLIKNSFSDGFYNTYSSFNNTSSSLYEYIFNLKINGFADWYIPSIDEWAFFAKNITKDYEIKKQNTVLNNLIFEKLNKKFYWSSTCS